MSSEVYQHTDKKLITLGQGKLGEGLLEKTKGLQTGNVESELIQSTQEKQCCAEIRRFGAGLLLLLSYCCYNSQMSEKGSSVIVKPGLVDLLRSGYHRSLKCSRKI